MRAAGLDYMEIARRGGGIHSSVRDLRAKKAKRALYELAFARLRRLASFGTTTVEVRKSRLRPHARRRARRRCASSGVCPDALAIRLVPTFLGARTRFRSSIVSPQRRAKHMWTCSYTR